MNRDELKILGRMAKAFVVSLLIDELPRSRIAQHSDNRDVAHRGRLVVALRQRGGTSGKDTGCCHGKSRGC